MVQELKNNANIKKPTAHIAVNKSRVKKYNKESETPHYYLEDGQEFQLELHNPRKYNVLAMVHLNGEPISKNGIVIRPGERIFLDRYLDEDRKLKFSTYEVPDDTSSKEAIEDNGDIEVEFYLEDTIKGDKKSVDEVMVEKLRREIEEIRRIKKDRWEFGPYPYYPIQPVNPPTTPYFPSYPWVTTSPNDHMWMNIKEDDPLTTNPAVYTTNTGSVSVSYSSDNDHMAPKENEDDIETGRVEKGDVSDQELKEVDIDFFNEPFSITKYKIYPLSQRPATSEDITKVRKYCHSCGAKKKPKFNFCPYCGEEQ